jgi:hypothetical protein
VPWRERYGAGGVWDGRRRRMTRASARLLLKSPKSAMQGWGSLEITTRVEDTGSHFVGASMGRKWSQKCATSMPREDHGDVLGQRSERHWGAVVDMP